MPTFIFTKNEFIKWIENQVKEKEVIVMTNELSGQMTANKKGTKLQTLYAPNCFVNNGLGHIVKGDSIPFGLIISKEKALTEKAKEALIKVERC